MRNCIIFLIVCSLTHIASSQSGWTVLHPFNVSDNYASTFFINSNTGFCAGSEGDNIPIIIRTTDSGLNWTKQSFPYLQYSNLNVIYFVNSFTGYCAGYGGLVMQTTDLGQNWVKFIVAPFQYQFNSICFININTGFVVGGFDSSIIARTTNAGLNWSTQILNNSRYYLNSIQFLNDNTGFMCGFRQIYDTLHGILYKTINGGNNWNSINNGGDIALWSLFFTDINTGFMIGKSGIGLNNFVNRILKTTNSGLNWTNLQVNTSNYNDFHDIKFSDSSNGYIIGGRGPNSVIIKTTNGGINWVEQNGGVNSPLLSCAVVSNNNVFVSGWEGVVLKTTNGGNSIGISPLGNYIPESFYLNQNYPNPFNPTTKIKFDIPSLRIDRDLSVNLKVYNILGEEISTLVNEQLKPGTYEVQFDATNYSSGIYLYRLEASDFIDTKKMIIIK